MALRTSWRFLVLAALSGCEGAALGAPYRWRNANIQGMGYVTGLVIHPDTRRAPNLIYIRTDVGGAYRYLPASNSWRPLLDRFGTQAQKAYGVESVALAASDPRKVFLATNAGILESNDFGATWSDQGLSGVYFGSNDLFRGSSGERLAVDPSRADVLYFGSRRDGLWRKSGEAPWTRLQNGLPPTHCTPQPEGCVDVGYTFVALDPIGGVGPEGARRIYVGVYGSGVWCSDDAGRSWSLIGGGVAPLRFALARDGTLYVTFGGGESTYEGPGSVRRFSHGGWTDITPGGKAVSYSGISVAASDPKLVMVTTNQALLFRSSDGGATWRPVPIRYVSQPAYYWRRDWYRWGTAALVIDPTDSSGRRVWKTDGFGVSRTDDASAGDPAWSTVMRGLEELVVNVVRSPPIASGPQIVSGVGDAEGFVHANVRRVPKRKLDPDHAPVSAVTSIDYSQSNPRRLAYVGWDETNPSIALSGVSQDGGATWRDFGSTKPGRAGVIAVSATDPDNMVWAPKNNGPAGAPVPVQFTRDEGRSWTPAQGLPPDSFYRASEWWYGQTLASDRVDGRRFYYLSQSAAGEISFWTSSDGGSSWTRTPARFEGAPAWNVCPMLKPNPYAAGEIWVSFCPSAQQSGPHRLYRSMDAGASFQILAGVDVAYNIAFGKGSSPGRPFVYLFGRVGGAGADGIYRSEDMGASWTLVSDPSRQQFGEMTYLEGDLRTPNLLYVGTSGRGILVGSDPPRERSRGQSWVVTTTVIHKPRSRRLRPKGTGANRHLQRLGSAKTE